jgi:hypothetical protein
MSCGDEALELPATLAAESALELAATLAADGAPNASTRREMDDQFARENVTAMAIARRRNTPVNGVRRSLISREPGIMPRRGSLNSTRSPRE